MKAAFPRNLSRAEVLKLTAASAFALASPACAQPAPAANSARPAAAANATDGLVGTRPIPSSGEALPIIGCGTWQGFDRPASEREPLVETLKVLFGAGGSVIDSSPMYGRAEAAVGDVLARIGGEKKAFLATKVWTRGRAAGIAQMETSMRLFGVQTIDLMQIHNLVDWRTHLDTLKGWKSERRIRYLGVTHYTPSAHDELEAVLRAERLDFVQIDYSAADRAVERRLLPLAADRGIAVIVNQPFGGGGLLRQVSSRPLPDFAQELECATWAQMLLKFTVGHPAVTCVIPGTGSPQHMRDNVRAGVGKLPDAAMRERIAQAIAA